MENKNTKYTYKDGLREGVMFCFLKDEMILLEDRGKGFDIESFFPSGSIEEKDKQKKGDYILNALYREVKEEFNNNIKIKNMDYLGDLKVPEINIIFYIYLVTEWDGEFPSVIIEDGELASNIKFFPIEEARSIFKYESAFETLKRILEHIKSK